LSPGAWAFDQGFSSSLVTQVFSKPWNSPPTSPRFYVQQNFFNAALGSCFEILLSSASPLVHGQRFLSGLHGPSFLSLSPEPAHQPKEKFFNLTFCSTSNEFRGSAFVFFGSLTHPLLILVAHVLPFFLFLSFKSVCGPGLF